MQCLRSFLHFLQLPERGGTSSLTTAAPFNGPSPPLDPCFLFCPALHFWAIKIAGFLLCKKYLGGGGRTAPSHSCHEPSLSTSIRTSLSFSMPAATALSQLKSILSLWNSPCHSPAGFVFLLSFFSCSAFSSHSCVPSPRSIRLLPSPEVL